jgi:transposase
LGVSECGAESKPYDHRAERGWRHLDTCQYQTLLHARPPRAECPEHGVRVVKLPWAEPSSRFTALFKALAIEWLKEASQKAVGERLGLRWDEIHGLMERAVKRGLERREAESVTRRVVDEKAFRKGHSHFTLVNDLYTADVLDRISKGTGVPRAGYSNLKVVVTRKRRSYHRRIGREDFIERINPHGISARRLAGGRYVAMVRRGLLADH